MMPDAGVALAAGFVPFAPDWVAATAEAGMFVAESAAWADVVMMLMLAMARVMARVRELRVERWPDAPNVRHGCNGIRRDDFESKTCGGSYGTVDGM